MLQWWTSAIINPTGFFNTLSQKSLYFRKTLLQAKKKTYKFGYVMITIYNFQTDLIIITTEKNISSAQPIIYLGRVVSVRARLHQASVSTDS